jgi:hypothetical protein
MNPRSSVVSFLIRQAGNLSGMLTEAKKYFERGAGYSKLMAWKESMTL